MSDQQQAITTDLPLSPDSTLDPTTAEPNTLGLFGVGGSDLQTIQQAEPSNVFDTDQNQVDTTSATDPTTVGPLAWIMQADPTTSDLSDPYFGYATTASTVSDPAASPQPFDVTVAQSDAETQRLAGYANGTLYQAGSSVSADTGTVIGGSSNTSGEQGLSTLYAGPATGSSIGGTGTLGAGQVPSTAQTQASGPSAITAQTEQQAAQALVAGLKLLAGPNNPQATAQKPLLQNPLFMIVAALFVWTVLDREAKAA